MKKLLITGISGFLGAYLGRIAQAKWQVYGLYHQTKPQAPGVTLLPIDLTDFPSVQALFQQVQPDAVIHTAAYSKPNLCQTNPERSYAVNVLAAWQLAELCAEQALPCVFTSTEQVFDGSHPPYRETDPVSPLNLYGEHKVLAEQGMLERHPRTAICRMPLMFGAATPAESFLQSFMQKLRSGQELTLFTDEIRTPVSVARAAQGLLLALEKWQGLLHLGGRDRVSRYELGQLLVEVFDLTHANIRACQQADVIMPAPRPPDVSMDSSLAFSLGYDPGDLRTELMALRGLV